MTTFRLTVEYDGTRYRGWQEQKNAHTVAGELRRALEEVCGERLELAGSGRTDAGVHALAQVAHARGALRIKPQDLQRETNARLPPDIHLLSCVPAADRFHARHSASARSYVYQIARRRTAFGKRFVWWVAEPLAVDRMRAAARALGGKKDFAAFCERPEEQSSTLVVVERVEIVEEGGLVLVRLVASHFLWRMVRRIVGTLVRVGTGELAPERFALLVSAGDPTLVGTDPARFTAPPSGLFLERVIYPGEAPLGPLRAPFPVSAA
jgi:tRNA pseudouridine38-40 synthase